jgi:hypothetical protein
MLSIRAIDAGRSVQKSRDGENTLIDALDQVSFWHVSDMPTALPNVRCWG